MRTPPDYEVLAEWIHTWVGVYRMHDDTAVKFCTVCGERLPDRCECLFGRIYRLWLTEKEHEKESEAR